MTNFEVSKVTKFNAKQLEILNSDPSIQAWLNEFSKESTQRQYASRLVRFIEATNITIADLKQMDGKEIKQSFLDFQKEQQRLNFKNNGILSIITAMRSYLLSIEITVNFRKGQLLNLEADNESHVFTNGDLKLLFDVSDNFEKALIATAVSEGWEISAFLEQDKEVVEKRLAHATQNNEKFIFFENTRQKTGVSRFCVLNPLAIEWLTKYLSFRHDDDSRLFPITQDGVQKMLYRLAEQSGLKTTGNLRFHNIRKWLMSRLSRCGFNEFQIKYIMGKSIGVSDRTYLQTLQSEIEDKYPKVYNDYLNIAPTIASADTKQIEKQMQTIFDQQQKEIDILKAQMFDASRGLLMMRETLKMMLESNKTDNEKLKAINDMLKFLDSFTHS